MARRWAGPLITLVIIGGVVMVLLANLEPTRRAPKQNPPPPPRLTSGKFREFPIGEEVEHHHIRVAAVWLPAVHMEGVESGGPDPDVIHLEADVKATKDNPNGFADGEFVPYLKIHYRIEPTGAGAAGPALDGELTPMVARDGLHYGAAVSMPRRGRYRLTYAIRPPSAGGLGRHDDPETGVDPWWAPFNASFDWDYQGVPPAQSAQN
jgi:uncharacterized protein involved in high-affinity Fe2+ transport